MTSLTHYCTLVPRPMYLQLDVQMRWVSWVLRLGSSSGSMCLDSTIEQHTFASAGEHLLWNLLHNSTLTC